jgi:hypothetical protein
MTEPGNEMAAGAGDDYQLLIYRERVTRTLRTALAQGRLTDDEYDERIGRASASRSRADLAALLPAPGTHSTPSQRPASAAPAGSLPPVDHDQQHTAEAAHKDLARRQSHDRRSAYRWRHRGQCYTIDRASNCPWARLRSAVYSES